LKNLLPIFHMQTEIKDDKMGIPLVELACLGRHGITQYKGLAVCLGEKVCNIRGQNKIVLTFCGVMKLSDFLDNPLNFHTCQQKYVSQTKTCKKSYIL
jgi:hypothetical protein